MGNESLTGPFSGNTVLRRKHLLISLLAAAILIFIFGINHFSLVIRLHDNNRNYLEYGGEYADPGGTVVLQGSLILKNGIDLSSLVPVIPVTSLPADQLGRHMIDYTASFLWMSASAQREVAIIDTIPPEITFSTELTEEQLALPAGPLRGITATDNFDGDITDRVTWKKTNGWITYSVIDSSGNPSYVVREVTASASQPPEIRLKGDAEQTITVGTFYEDPGFQASDSVDGDLTHLVTTEGEVNWLAPGTYPIVYSVSDTNGNVVTARRKVTVEAKPRPKIQWPQEKTVYLTFDDGPSPFTAQLLDILDQYGVRATFFVTASDHADLMKEIVRRGHSIGIHTVTHDYDSIYASPEAYFDDLYAMQNQILKKTGVLTTLIRFPGGSSNQVSSDGLMPVLCEAVQDAGFQYFDWNVDSDDAGGARDSRTVYQNVTDGIAQEGTSIVLQHDIHDYSVGAVEDIIRWGLDQGYRFAPLTDRSPGFHHELTP